MLVCFIFFGTKLPVSKRFQISKICVQICFHNNKCILIHNSTITQIFKYLALKLLIIRARA